MEHDHSVLAAVIKVVTAWTSFIGALTLTHWSLIVGIGATLLVSAYTALQFYVLWRDKIARYRPPGSHTRATDHADL